MLSWIKSFLSNIYHFSRSSDYRLLNRSILFDSAYYLKKYPDVAELSANPILHYLNFGHLEKRQPSVFFDPIYYEEQLSDSHSTEAAPLVQYLTKGYKTQLSPHPLFDPVFYSQQYPELKKPGENPYLKFIIKEFHSTRATTTILYFDPDFYCTKNPDVKEKGINPYLHYLKTGIDEGLQPCLWFNTAWYQDRHNLQTSPLTHYLISGCKENKSPNPLFDPIFYTNNYQIEDAPDPFLHYLDKGITLNQKPCSWFDPHFYQTHYQKECGGSPPLQHFLTKGLKTGFYPNKEIYDFKDKPKISILVPVYNAEPAQIGNCIRSILYQSYPYWELCLSDDCSTNSTIRPLLEYWTAQDKRIKSVFLKKNSGISRATNMAASLATGDYLGLLDNDDELALEALAKLVEQINLTGSDLLYSDEDLIGSDARRYSIFRKPAFNRELLLSHNYVTHFVLTKRSLYEKVGGCDSQFDGAQDLDLFLKLSEQADQITHCPEILYHWRASASSTSINHTQKDYANKAGKMAIEAALQRTKIAASVSYTSLKFYYRIKREIVSQPSVAVIINFETSPPDDPVSWLSRLIQNTNFSLDEIVALCCDKKQCSALKEFALCSKTKIDITVKPGDATGLAKLFNSCSRNITSEYIIFLTDAIEIRNSDWAESLIEYGQLAETGMVGGKIICEDEELEPVTQVPETANDSPTYYAKFITNASILMNGRHCPQEVLSVNEEFCLIKTALFRKMEGFNEHAFPHLFLVHDLCYRIARTGRKNIFTPYANAFWRNIDQDQQNSEKHNSLEEEKKTFQETWSTLLRDGDPYYNKGIVQDANKSVDEFIAWLRGDPSHPID